MVCSLGIGRMEVMARFLAAGSFSQTIADDFGRSAAEYICRELREADEANLLDEEDMHVYGQSPMTDLLQLVCCNFCKKPIKDSQYAIHAAQMQHWSRLTASTSPSDMASHHIRGRYSDSSCSNLLEFIPLDPCIPQTPLEFKYNLTLESQSTYEGPSALALPVHRVSPKYVLNSSSLE